MGTKTQNYQLNQWEATDNFLRADFNEDNAKIDAALLRCDIAVGQYTGSANTNTTSTKQTINLGFRPRAVLVFPHSMGGSYQCANLALDGVASNGVTITDNGFTVTAHANLAYANSQVQATANPYRYIAFH